MKKRDVILAVVFAALLILSACSKLASVRQEDADTLISKPEQDITSDVQTEPAPEPEQESKDTALSEQDDPSAPQEEPEEQHFPTPSPEVLKLRLQNASVCTCLMEEGARWRLITAGALTPDTQDEAFLQALKAISNNFSEHPEQYAPFVNNTLWLLESSNDGLLLHFLQAVDGNTVKCQTLLCGSAGVQLSEAPEICTEYYLSACANASNGAEEEFSYALNEDSFVYISGLPDDALAVAILHFSDKDAWRNYPFGSISGDMILSPADIPSPTMDDDLHRAALQVQYDTDTICDADKIRLSAFVDIFLCAPDRDSHILWDAPAPIATATHEALSYSYEVKNAMLTLVRELERDDALKSAFLMRKTWTLCRDGMFNFCLQATDYSLSALTAHIYLGGVDVDGWETPTVQHLRLLAQTGKNSEYVPQAVQEEFVEYALRDDRNGTFFTEVTGQSEWIWHIDENDTYSLEIRTSINGQKDAYVFLLKYDANGDIVTREFH